MIVCVRAVNGEYSIGAVVQYVGAVVQLSEGIRMLASSLQMIQIQAPFCKKFLDFIDIDEHSEQDEQKKTGQKMLAPENVQEITFDHVYKWIALDAANCCWYYDDQSEYLSVEELRRNIIERKNIGIHFASRFCPRVNIGAKEKEQMLQYLCKNMFRFYCSAGRQKAGMEVYYHLIPCSFLPSGIQYAHDIYGNDTMIISTTDAEQFWRSPELEEL